VKHSHSGDSCAVKMNRLSAAGCQDIVSFGDQLNLNCVYKYIINKFTIINKMQYNYLALKFNTTLLKLSNQ
jgi:hypothetical protein